VAQPHLHAALQVPRSGVEADGRAVGRHVDARRGGDGLRPGAPATREDEEEERGEANGHGEWGKRPRRGAGRNGQISTIHSRPLSMTTRPTPPIAAFAPAAALLGGGALILHYALHLDYGLRSGGILWDAMQTPLGRTDALVFNLAFGLIDVALLGLAARLAVKAPRLARTGAGFAALALAACAVGLVSFQMGSMVPFVMPTATLAMFVGALLLGIGALRSRALPRGVGVALVLFALFTAPLAFACEALGAWAGWPPYVGFEVHFVAAGAAWLYVGRRLTSPRLWLRLASA